MCLYTQDIYPSIAEKDITCYKMVKLIYHDMMTPYMNLPLSDKILRGEELLCADDAKRTIFNEFFSLNEIRSGYIHTYSSFGEVKMAVIHEQTAYINPFISPLLIAYECIIPKGSEYYEGYSENGTYYSLIYKSKKNMPLNSYASDKIKFVRKITDMEMFGYERRK